MSFIEFITKELVDKSDEVKVEEVVDGDIIMLKLTVAPDEMGKIIGKEGRMVKAMRTLLGAMGAKQKKRVALEVVDRK